MRAFVLSRYGGADATSLQEIPVREPQSGEVRIRVRAAGLNPVDFKLREGKLKLVSPLSLPLAIGSELSGTVEAIGSGVTRFAVGDDVFARVAKDKLGAFAEQACVSEDLVARKPARLDFVQAAAVPLASLTAFQALHDELGLAKGQRIYIPGGAGGVGTFAIQLAKHFGASVTTSASSRGKELVERLGADLVVDYREKDFARDLRGYDCAFDLVGGDTLAGAFEVVRSGGRVVSIAGLPEPTTATKDLGRGVALATLFWFASLGIRLRARRHGVSYRYLFMRPDGAQLGEIARLVDAKVLDVVVDRVFPFAEIGDAFAYLEQGRAKGKVVVEM